MEEDNTSSKKGRVCVTGGTGFLGSWLILKLLQSGYAVNTTVRPNPDGKRDVSYLTNLPGASAERLQIFNADLEKPETFAPAIQGCTGVFHVAHALDLKGEEDEETKTKRAINGVLAILQACIDSKTVKRFIYTSSASTVKHNGKNSDIVDEDSWTDVGLMRSRGASAGYAISKTLTEKAATEFAENHGLDFVTVIPSWIHGPFICSHFPDSVKIFLALIFGDQEHYKYISDTSLVHVDDVARAHVFLFEYPNAKGRYLCSALHVTIHELCEFIPTRYPQYQLPINADSLKELISAKFSGFSSKKLLETGFKFQHGLEDMFDDAIRCCKEKGFL